MIKRDIVETVYEYDKDGKLTRKSVTETHETDDETRYPLTNLYNCITTTSCECQDKCGSCNDDF
jgi:hypothetical protein